MPEPKRRMGRPLNDSGTRVLIYFSSEKLAAAMRRFCIDNNIAVSSFIAQAVERQLAESGVNLGDL